MENTIETKMIPDLKDMRFLIPAYQRGYRWTRQEVRDLLSDLMEFNSQNGTQKYCLQPFVVRKMPDNRWEVIDGQQRLTTIYIFLKVAIEEIKSAKSPYELEYETRPDSAEFLQNLSENSRSNKKDNIDYYYMVNAWEAMKEWFDEQPDYATAVLQIYPKMMNDTQIIWYQINDDSEPVDIFTKINVGKIPLTNAELIKALFLKRENFILNGVASVPDGEIYKRQLEISTEWDRIEQSLREDAFWMFLCNDEKAYDTRIDFIFDLLAKEQNKSLQKPILDVNNKYFPFLVFDKLFKEKTGQSISTEKLLDGLWEQIGRYHAVFKEWYRNDKFYHLMGYLISTGVTAESIKHGTEGMKKTEIEEYLNDLIRNSVKDITNLDNLTYDNSNDKGKIRRVLLLFNIQTLIKSKASVRFPFDLYKSQSWDIEHIHAIKTKSPETSVGRIEWLSARKNELNGIDTEAVEQIDAFIENGGVEDISKYEQFCDDLNCKYGELDINDISNLTLLDAVTNRSYKNAFFPVKRRIIIERDKGAVFIPVCTKNVFLKLYSQNPSDLICWSVQDRKEYVEEIRRMLAGYIAGGMVNE